MGIFTVKMRGGHIYGNYCRLIKMNLSRLTQISGKPRCTGFWAWGENHGRAVELYRESIEATQVARCPDYVDFVALMTLTIK